ncbi:hypothetical protein GGS26DRAFT_597183 [Hypomontagnella submonticulosa]|nr:hypothetical protein GGS26DRAFT_597183 [Hypomontagnella submonticulosa]
MGGQFTPTDPVRCPHYAQFASRLDRIHFDGIYWTFFFLVIGILFVSSWIYQSTMMYREKPEYREDVFRNKVKLGLVWCTILFLVAAVLLVVEVFALLALQFCDGEDLMSLYWATWTMLQLGSSIAILGIDLALWHHLSNVRMPLWALALGTPVLVVAGFGHVIHIVLRKFYKRARAHRHARKASSDVSDDQKGTVTPSSSANSIKPKDKHIEDPDASEAGGGRAVYFAMDVGDDERVKQWPSFVGVLDGKAIIRLTAYEGHVLP